MTGEVVALERTGNRSGDDPVIKLTLEVTCDGEPPYQHTLEQVVPVVHVPSIQPNAVLRLKIDPAGRERMVIDEDWAHPGR